MLLYIETISETTKIIVYSDQVKELSRQILQTNRSQTDELIFDLDKLIHGQRDQVEGIFINTSAGSYTSARIGLTVANSLGFALNVQPVSVDSPAEIRSGDWRGFDTPLLPTYQNKPFITKKKDRL